MIFMYDGNPGNDEEGRCKSRLITWAFNHYTIAGLLYHTKSDGLDKQKIRDQLH